MKKRWAFRLLMYFTASLFVPAVLLFLWSFTNNEFAAIRWGDPGAVQYSIYAINGVAYFQIHRWTLIPASEPPSIHRSFAGFSASTYHVTTTTPLTNVNRSYGPNDQYGVTLLWPLLATACSFIVAIRSLRRTRPAGCCRKCGYDLRATPERCPECGAIPKAAKGATP